MNKFETPIQFDIQQKIDNSLIKYLDLVEISQGGPEVGRISINGNEISTYLFGGPYLWKNDYLFVPAYIKRFLGYGFKLAKINLKNLEVELLGNFKDLIFLNRIEDDKIYFYEDIDKTIPNSSRI